MTQRGVAAVLLGAGWLVSVLLGGCGGNSSGTPVIAAGDAVVGATAMTDAAAYLTVDNPGASDRLVGVTSPDARSVTMHMTETLGAATAMLRVDSLEVRAAGSLRFEPGGDHLMLEGLHEPVEVGDVIRLRLTFEHAGSVDVAATAVPLQELPERIARR